MRSHYSLRELDIELMKRLAPRVNVIPVVGRADSLTPAELAESKKLVMEDIEHYRIPVYNFPYDIEEDDEDTVEENAELRGLMPFAIVGSEEVVEIEGRSVRARQYPWGVVEVDNPRHSDFLAIRSALLHSHLADLKEITHDFLYENYRTEKLSKSVEGGGGAYVPLSPTITVVKSSDANMGSQRLLYEPGGPRVPVRPSQGGAAPPRGGEAPRDRGQGAARDQREAARAPGSGIAAQGDRGSHAARDRVAWRGGGQRRRNLISPSRRRCHATETYSPLPPCERVRRWFYISLLALVVDRIPEDDKSGSIFPLPLPFLVCIIRRDRVEHNVKPLVVTWPQEKSCGGCVGVRVAPVVEVLQG